MKEWFIDTSPDLNEDERCIEQPSDAFDCAPLGSIATLDRCRVIATEEWQLVPVSAGSSFPKRNKEQRPCARLS